MMWYCVILCDQTWWEKIEYDVRVGLYQILEYDKNLMNFNQIKTRLTTFISQILEYGQNMIKMW